MKSQSEAKWTSWPWSYAHEKSQTPKVTGGSTTVCWMDFWTHEGSEIQKPECVTEANAKLIAQAPDMLSLLESALFYFDDSNAMPSLACKIRSVIARAKGEVTP